MLCAACDELCGKAAQAFLEPPREFFRTYEDTRIIRSFRDGVKLNCLICQEFKSRILRQLTQAANVLDPAKSLDDIDSEVLGAQICLATMNFGADTGAGQMLHQRIRHLNIEIETPNSVRHGHSGHAIDLLTEEQINESHKLSLGSMFISRMEPTTQFHSGLISLYESDGMYAAIIRQMSQWLQDDTAEQKMVFATTTSSEPAFYPKRLVCLSSFKAGTFVVQNTLGWEPGAEFAALSYRWEEVGAFKCTTRNLKDLSKGHSLSALSKNMMQAMGLVHDLGVLYIWIDALCILQDSSADWRDESVQMEKIYSSATFTLAMNFDWTVQSPLLDNLVRNLRDQNWPRALVLRKHTVSRRRPGHMIGRACLGKRAWCLQERLLSKRTIHILDTNIIWEGTPQQTRFLSVLTCPFPRIADGRDIQSARFPPSQIGLSRHRVDDGGHRPVEEFLLAWFWVVEDYSRRELTMKRDKLVAIQAVAQRLSLSTGFIYNYGLWSVGLPFCLCWSPPPLFSGYDGARSDTELNRGARVIDVPSWSWAKLDAPVSYPLFFELDSTRFALIQATFLDEDHGRLLAVWGMLYEPAQTVHSYKHTFHNDGNKEDLGGEEKGWTDSTNVIQLILHALGATNVRETSSSAALDQPENAHLQQTWLLPVAVQVHNTETLAVIALILSRRTVDGNTSYVRVGILEKFFSAETMPEKPHLPDASTIRDKLRGSTGTEAHITRENTKSKAGTCFILA